MLPEQQPTCASLNLASLYKIELSCQRFINFGNRVIKIGAILNQNCGILTKSPSQTVYDIDRDTIFAKQIFGASSDDLDYCLCGIRKLKNLNTIQVLIRDNDTSYWAVICGNCLMEYMDKDVRMSRMGLIDLPLHILHSWYIPYISKLLMCSNKFIFNCLYGENLILIRTIQDSVRFDLRNYIKIPEILLESNSKPLNGKLGYTRRERTSPGSYIEIDGSRVFGVMVSQNSDRLANYDAWFMREYDAKEIIFSANREVDLFSDIFNSPNFSIEKDTKFHGYGWGYKLNLFENFVQNLKRNQFVYIVKDYETQQFYEDFFKSFVLNIYDYLKILRNEEIILNSSANPLTLVTSFRLMRLKTVSRFYNLFLEYNRLSKWVNFQFFIAQSKNRRTVLSYLQKLMNALSLIKNNRQVIFDLLTLNGQQFQNVVKTTVQPKFFNKLNFNLLQFEESASDKLNEKLIDLLRKLYERRKYLRTYSVQKINRTGVPSQIEKNDFYLSKKYYTPTDLMSIPILKLSNLEKNWIYDYQSLTFQELKITKLISIYNNYWEMAARPIEKQRRQLISSFFTSDWLESSASLGGISVRENENIEIYEQYFLTNPRTIWHNLHLLPFNLNGRSHISWKEMLTIYGAPIIDRISMVKFMLQNLSDSLVKNKKAYFPITTKIKFGAILFIDIFKQTLFKTYNNKRSQLFFNIFLYNKVDYSNSFFSFNLFLKKFITFIDPQFSIKYVKKYTDVSSNIKLRNTWRSAITHKKTINGFTDFFPSKNQKNRLYKRSQFSSSHIKFISRKFAREQMFQIFQRSRTRFEWVILSNLPILPVDLRPIVTLSQGNNVVTVRSEINNLYSSIVYRAKWVIRMQQHKNRYPHDLQITNMLLLQQSVENLFGNPYNQFRSDTLVKNKNEGGGFSLLDRLKGKFGRLRRQLLGKRVDYSGRSVIVVGPLLELNMCALPFELGFQIFQPLLIHALSSLKIAPNLTAAKRMISTSQPRVKLCLQDLTTNEIVLLNRAPTLHRMNFQAFYPILTESKAILLHPLVCSSFNADFDGDQMAVHLPLSMESRLEARIIMMASHNLLSPSTGTPTILPTQDMVLGSYYLTMEPPSRYLLKEYYIQLNRLSIYLRQQSINLHDWVWIQHSGLNIQKRQKMSRIFESRIYGTGVVWSLYPKHQIIDNYLTLQAYSYIGATFGRVVFNKVLGLGSSQIF